MNRNNMYTIVVIICILAVIASYKLINTELQNTKLTPINTKTQPCPDYWTYDTKNKCCDPSDGDCYDFSDLTFCDKQRILEMFNEYTDIDIPWNGISNIYNPRCDIKVEPHTDNSPDYYENNNEYNYIYNILVYSLLMMVFVILDFIFGKRGQLLFFALIFIIIELILLFLLGVNIYFFFFSKNK